MILVTNEPIWAAKDEEIPTLLQRLTHSLFSNEHITLFPPDGNARSSLVEAKMKQI
jgi:hypothetical protein